MAIKAALLLTLFISYQLCWSQGITKLAGPLSVYDMLPGYSYSDSAATDSASVQSIVKFGELFINDESSYKNVPFLTRIDTAMQWMPNKILGIVVPPTENGVPNQPDDTALYSPYPHMHSGGPGMIQGGQRFSRLSELYGGFSGVILDDWNGDTALTHQIHDATLGKYIDPQGNVYGESTPTTPYNKLYCVLYSANAVPAALPYMDGVVFSIASQSCCYMGMDSDISVLQANFPHKEIITAIFLQNSVIGGWASPASVQYLLAHTLDRYDDGDINGVTIFAALFLLKGQVPLTLWDSFALVPLLDSLYYPYLGAGRGTVYDCTGGGPLTGANVHVFYKSKTTGDTLSRSYQKADINGNYEVGLWAGNRNTDSNYYWLIAEKNGYITDTAGFWIKRGVTTIIPDITLCPGLNKSENLISIYPNPVQNWCNVVINDANYFYEQIEVYNELGQRMAIQTTSTGDAGIDMSGWSSGIYIVKVGDTVRKIVKQ
jgi:hypothetical protein